MPARLLKGAHADRVGAAERACECVGLVGLNVAFDVEQHADHALHHGLVGAAGGADGLLDFARREFFDLESREIRRRKRRPSGLAEKQRALGVDVDEDPFGGGEFGLRALDHDGKLTNDVSEPSREFARGHSDHAALNAGEFSALGVDDAPARAVQPGVQAQDPHCAGQRPKPPMPGKPPRPNWPSARIILLRPPRFMRFIMSCVCSNCLSRRLTS